MSITFTPLNKLTLPDKLLSHILTIQQVSHKSVISLKDTMTASDYRTKVPLFNCFSEATVAIHRYRDSTVALKPGAWQPLSQ